VLGDNLVPCRGKSIYTFFGGRKFVLEDIFCLEDVSGQNYFGVENFGTKWEESKSGIHEDWVSSCI
jgi:hypothetical protein